MQHEIECLGVVGLAFILKSLSIHEMTSNLLKLTLDGLAMTLARRTLCYGSSDFHFARLPRYLESRHCLARDRRLDALAETNDAAI